VNSQTLLHPYLSFIVNISVNVSFPDVHTQYLLRRTPRFILPRINVTKLFQKCKKGTEMFYIQQHYKINFLFMKPLVQISLDLTNIDEALETAALAMRAGVDWLEAGTPLILAEGLRGVQLLRAAFPNVPIVADLKTMDGGYLEAEMMAKAGATHVVVMARAHEEIIKCVVKAGKDFNIKVMGDNLACDDMVAAAKWVEDLGCDYVIHHIGYDERRGIAARGERMPSPLDELREVVNAVKIPVQAVGGLTLEQAIQCPAYGAPLVVLGAPLTIDADAFKTADGNLEVSLRLICEAIHAYGDITINS
jgi:3-hexulose-6-phosphate synthase